MTTTEETKLKQKFLQRWESLEEILREVALHQLPRVSLSDVLKFLWAIEIIDRSDCQKLNLCQTTRAVVLQPGVHIDHSVQKGIDDFMLFADDLEKRLCPIIEE